MVQLQELSSSIQMLNSERNKLLANFIKYTNEKYELIGKFTEYYERVIKIKSRMILQMNM